MLLQNPLNPIIIGNGTKVVGQYPKKGTTVSAGTKVFVVTNELTYTMPDVTGWSSTEFVDFCNLLGVEYILNGYGYVTSTSIPAGSVIDITQPIEATCATIEPASLVTSRE